MAVVKLNLLSWKGGECIAGNLTTHTTLQNAHINILQSPNRAQKVAKRRQLMNYTGVHWGR